MAKTKLKPVKSLGELYNKAQDDPAYADLLFAASDNLGGHSADLYECYRWLITNAQETGDEDGVVDEVNFCIDLV